MTEVTKLPGRMNRQWLLARRPQGMVSVDDFQLVEQPIPGLSDGQVLVRNLYLSCDRAQRGWIGRDTYLPAVKLGAVMRSIAAGEVVESRNSRFESGQVVQGMLGWQDFAVVNPDSSVKKSVASIWATCWRTNSRQLVRLRRGAGGMRWRRRILATPMWEITPSEGSLGRGEGHTHGAPGRGQGAGAEGVD